MKRRKSERDLKGKMGWLGSGEKNKNKMGGMKENNWKRNEENATEE